MENTKLKLPNLMAKQRFLTLIWLRKRITIGNSNYNYSIFEKITSSLNEFIKENNQIK